VSVTRCARCRGLWVHNAGPAERFTVVTRVCPNCVPLLYKAVNP